MTTDLIRRICLAAPAERIYRVITTAEGIKGWWTTDVKMDTSRWLQCRQLRSGEAES